MAGVQMSLHSNVLFENGNLVLRLTMRTAAAVLIHHGGSALTGRRIRSRAFFSHVVLNLLI